MDKISTISDLGVAMSKGYILLAGANVAMLVMRPKWGKAGEFYAPVDVSYELFDSAKSSHHIGEINEQGIPPLAERPKHGTYGWKSGWREMELEPPPEGQAYYLMVQ